MTTPLALAARLYWEASQALRGRLDGPARATAAGYLATQARQPAHLPIGRRCRRAIAEFGLDGERIRYRDADPPDGPEAA